MAPRIFVIGVTGYIGGHFVDRLTQAHPEYHVVGLVRSEAQGKQVTNQYPKLETVLGDLDSHDVLVKEASEADVILRKRTYHFIPALLHTTTSCNQSAVLCIRRSNLSC